MDITQSPSPNFNDRKQEIDLLVLHYTGMKTGAEALERMLDANTEVSAHYMVWEDGRIVQLVEEDKRAWHAGVSGWQGDDDLNSRSIGIEIVNGGHDWPLPDGGLPPYPPAQIESVSELCKSILDRHVIAPTRIVGHSDIAPARKADPGEHFPWAQLARSGIGIWPEIAEITSLTEPLLQGDTGAPVLHIQQSLAVIGYSVDESSFYDEATLAAIRAFQQRFLPAQVNGHAGLPTRSRLAQIADAYTASSGLSSFQA